MVAPQPPDSGGASLNLSTNWGFRQNSASNLALHADSAPVDNPQRAKSHPVRFDEVLFHHGLHVARRHAVQIKDVSDRNPHRFISEHRIHPATVPPPPQKTASAVPLDPKLKTANLRYVLLNSLSKPECILELQANNMMKTTITAIITLLGAFTASATTVTYNFSTPANQSLGSSSQSFASTPTGYSITAYGFENGVSNNLYLKNEGTSETGLGLAS